ncbi:TNF receptor-associated factor 2-like [Ptychodera flava]|uniref:TNF receptor-associated factor 2-like n=1 Tax=Ptychodera flava TaxID=63121 RepID=UPI00396A9705
MSVIQVRCVNEGCDWKGTFKQYDDEHFLTCPMKICENAGCDAKVHRCELADHVQAKCVMRLVSCQYCGFQVVFRDLDKHNGKCSRYPTTCQYCQRQRIPREEVYEDMAIQAMSVLQVKCVHEGCEWKGTFKQYDLEHFLTCPMKKVTCENAGCGAEIHQSELTDHLQTKCVMRLVSCKYCGHKKHNGKCSRYPTTCQYCQRQRIPREELKNHQDTERGDCPKKPVICKFREVGCEELIEQDKTEEQNTMSLLSMTRNCNCIEHVDEVKKISETNGRMLQNVLLELNNLKTNVNRLNGKENTDMKTEAAHSGPGNT